MIKYDRLWKTLEERGISGNSFYKDYGVSKGQISRLKQNKYVSTHTLARICALLECDITDTHKLDELIGEKMREELVEQVELLDGASFDFDLDAAGTQAFAEASRDLYPTKGQIVIILDNEVQSAPAVQSEIPNGQVQITGNYSLAEAQALQTVLESGSLPVSFEYSQSQVVGPTLGQDALRSGVMVALLGILLVMIYLLFFYKGLGTITAGAVVVFAILYLGILAGLSAFGLFSLTLSGVAGIVKKAYDGVKVLGNGTVEKSLTVKVAAYSESAKAKIEAAGGKVEAAC